MDDPGRLSSQTGRRTLSREAERLLANGIDGAAVSRRLLDRLVRFVYPNSDPDSVACRSSEMSARPQARLRICTPIRHYRRMYR